MGVAAWRGLFQNFALGLVVTLLLLAGGTHAASAATLNINNVSANEGDGTNTTATFTVAVAGPNTTGITVDYATQDGTAIGGDDYTITSGTLTIPVNVQSKTFTVPIIGDIVDDDSEYFYVNLSNATNAGINTSQGTCTITDNDASTDGISIADKTVTEGNSGTTNATFTLSLTKKSARVVTVDYNTQDGSAASSEDYVYTSGTATFASNTLTTTVTVPVNGDINVEGDEYFNVELSNANGPNILDSEAVCNITNDDASPNLSIADATVVEGDAATKTLNLTVSLAAPSSTDVSSYLSTTDGTATNGTDFSGGQTFVYFTIPAGQTSVAVPINILGDVADEGTENFTVSIEPGYLSGQATLFDGNATVTITDDDSGGGLSIADLAIAEGDAASKTINVVVSVAKATPYDISSYVTTTDGTAINGSDYAGGQTFYYFTIPAGQSSTTVPITVYGDIADEGNETFTVSIEPTYLSGNVNIKDADATVTLTNDDAGGGLSIADLSVPEGDAANSTINVTLSVPKASPSDITGYLNSTDGTAVNGTDYAGGTTFVGFTLPAGQTSLLVPITVYGNIADEANKTFTLSIDSTYLSGNVNIKDGDATVTLTNDDAGAGVSLNDVVVTENDPGYARFTATLSKAAPNDLYFYYSTASGTATEGVDYSGTSGYVYFPAGTTAVTIDVPITDDFDIEGTENFTLNLTADSYANGVSIVDGTGVGTIVDDETTPAITVGDVSTVEGNSGTKTLNFPVTLNSAAPYAVMVNYSFGGGTASSSSDYTATAGTLTIPRYGTSGTISVTIKGDTLYENDETFNVTLSNPVNATIADGLATGTITNDDTTPPSLVIGDASITEGNSGTKNLTFTLTQSVVTGRTTTVAYATANGTTNPATAGSDYTTTSGTATIAAGATSTTVNVPITGDALYENNETFFVNLTSPVNATISDNQALGTITNDDAVPTISIGNVSVTEGNSGTVNANFTVTQSAVSSFTTTFNYATSDGTTNPATAGSDYTAGSGPKGIAAGQTSTTITVPVNGDTTYEANETFFVTLSTPANATIATSKGTGTIVNDDSTVPANSSINPNFVISTYGTAKTFSAVYSDPDGYGDISNVQMIVAPTLATANVLALSYDAPTNKLYLKNDAGTALLGGFAPGSANTISNSQGSLNCASTTIGRSGTTLTVNWNVTPTQAFIGTKNLYLYVKDAENLTDGFDDLGDWVIKASTNSVPLDVSIAPASSANIVNTARTFGAVYSDPDGALDIGSANLLINTTLNPANALWGYYDSPTNKLYLKNDAGTALLGGFAPGSANTITNTQGSLNCANTVVARSGNNLTIYWNMTPSASFVGTKNLYLYVKDSAGAIDGFDDLGDWLVKAPTNTAPTLVSLAPANSANIVNTARTFGAVYSDADGALDITSVQFIINATLTQANGLVPSYDPATDKLFLKNDAGTALIGGFTPGSANVISNSQGSLNCANTVVVRNGNTLTVYWNVTPSASFTGVKNLYQYVRDASNASAGFTDLGDWLVKTSTNVAPTVVSVTPSVSTSATGVAKSLSAVYSDADNALDITSVQFIVNSTLTQVNGLAATYDLATNKLFLKNDAGTTLIGGFEPGSANVISNSQGSLNCAATTVTRSGNNLTVNWNFTPASSFTGTKNLYLFVKDTSNASAGFTDKGDWTITAGMAPMTAPPTLSPSGGSS